MADDKPKHEHHKDDIIIRDQDGSYKILREGHFVPLDEAEAMEHGLKKESPGPKRAPDAKDKPVPQFQPAKPTEKKPEMKEVPKAKPEKQPEMASPSEVAGLADQKLRQQAADILKKSGVTFASGEQKQRAETILVSFIKGVRKSFETKDNLMKPPQNGGAGLDESEAQRLLSAAGAKDMPERRPDLDVSATKQPQNEMVKPMGGSAVGAEVSAPPSVGIERAPAASMPASAPSKPASAPKPSVSDVAKPSVPVVGLAGELAYSLADWRRISPNPQDRIKKIENQLGVLEEENFPTKMRGMRAWRDSEVMHLYLDAGKKSLETGSPLPQLLGNGSGDQLSWAEWQAVAELNDRIRG